MTRIPEIGIVVVNYLTYRETIAFVRESLFIQEKVILRIAIVDNGSDNASFEHLSKEFYGEPNIEIIGSDENGGYAKGNNIGIKHLKNLGCSWIIVSNSDIVIENPFLISELYEAYFRNEHIAFIAPVMMKNGKADYGKECWHLPTKTGVLMQGSYILGQLYKFLNRDWRYRYSNSDPAFKADCLSGSFFAGKTSVFDAIGLFDENTFLYYEETIIGHKVRNLGLGNFLVPYLCYEHRQGSVTSSVMSYYKRQRILMKSKLYYWRTYRDTGPLFSTLVIMIFAFNIIEAGVIDLLRMFIRAISKLYPKGTVSSALRSESEIL